MRWHRGMGMPTASSSGRRAGSRAPPRRTSGATGRWPTSGPRCCGRRRTSASTSSTCTSTTDPTAGWSTARSCRTSRRCRTRGSSARSASPTPASRRSPSRARCWARGTSSACRTSSPPRHPGSYGELRYCDEHGIAFLPWSPLGGTGGGGRTVGERFGVFREIGDAHGVSPQQVVLAWELALSPVVVPIPGARRAASITDSAAAADLVLTDDEVSRCSDAVGIER